MNHLLVMLICIAAGFTLMPAQASAQRNTEALAACAPKDLAESVACLDEHLPETAMTQFAEGPDARRRHFGIGLFLRNNWGLWRDGELAQFFAGNGVRHPDSMSAVILDSYDLYLAGCRLNWNDISLVRATSPDACAHSAPTQN